MFSCLFLNSAQLAPQYQKKAERETEKLKERINSQSLSIRIIKVLLAIFSFATFQASFLTNYQQSQASEDPQ